MSKTKKDPLLEALKEGRSHTWTVPDDMTQIQLTPPGQK